MTKGVNPNYGRRGGPRIFLRRLTDDHALTNYGGAVDCSRNSYREAQSQFPFAVNIEQRGIGGVSISAINDAKQTARHSKIGGGSRKFGDRCLIEKDIRIADQIPEKLLPRTVRRVQEVMRQRVPAGCMKEVPGCVFIGRR